MSIEDAINISNEMKDNKIFHLTEENKRLIKSVSHHVAKLTIYAGKIEKAEAKAERYQTAFEEGLLFYNITELHKHIRKTLGE